MLKNKMHLIPNIIQDIGEKLSTSRNINEKQAYFDRIVAIKEYCDYLLSKYEQETIYKVDNTRYNIKK